MNMRRTVYEMIFARLQQMGIIDESGKTQADYMKFVSSGLMSLNVDKLTYDTIALAHNGKQNGDVMADPDMEVRIYPDLKMAEALTFRNDYMGIYQEVYPETGKYYPKLKKELNEFLNNWLKTMIEIQRYQLAV
ncbi:DUF1249 domain-containing protein [Methanosarcina sp. DH1]|nr:DUF1249 domain-containing protein [Methanosarcina sp. DH1]